MQSCIIFAIKNGIKGRIEDFSIETGASIR
jgi:hypothetical protein